MLCPIQTFKVLPHIIEAIFVTHLGSYGDFMRCKTVNKAWREALDAIEQHEEQEAAQVNWLRPKD